MKKRVAYTNQALAFAESMPEREQIRLRRIVARLEDDGYLVAPFGEKVEGYANLFAIRIASGRNIRFFYAYAIVDVVWILSGYEKKRQSIPAREIERALSIRRSLGI